MKAILLATGLMLCMTISYSQGCSDAGFCSLGALKDVNLRSISKQSIDLGTNLGIGEQSTFTVSPYVQYNRQLNRYVSIQTKLTFTYATGFLGETFSPGDFYGSVTYEIPKVTTNSLRLLGGFKIPLTSSNSKNNDGRPLPLDYQSSIGTYDFIAGLNYIHHRKVELAAGLQLPVIQINKNTFFPEEFADARAREFPATNNFRRRPDVLFRAGCYINLSSSVTIKPNLLSIYHLGKDTYENRFGKRTGIDGSEGLTLNAGIIATKQFKNKNRLELVAAAPFIAREVRADGLTRKVAFTFQYSIPL